MVGIQFKNKEQYRQARLIKKQTKRKKKSRKRKKKH